MFTGSTFTFGVWLLKKYPPKRINHWYGYRTSSSKKNLERWDFAQNYSAQTIVNFGFILIILGIASLFITLPNEESIALGIVTILLAVIILITRVEKAIKKNLIENTPQQRL